MTTPDTMAVTAWAELRLPYDPLSAELLAAIVIPNSRMEPDSRLPLAEWDALFTPTTIEDLSVGHLLDTCRRVDRIIERMLELREAH